MHDALTCSQIIWCLHSHDSLMISTWFTRLADLNAVWWFLRLEGSCPTNRHLLLWPRHYPRSSLTLTESSYKLVMVSTMLVVNAKDILNKGFLSSSVHLHKIIWLKDNLPVRNDHKWFIHYVQNYGKYSNRYEFKMIENLPRSMNCLTDSNSSAGAVCHCGTYCKFRQVVSGPHRGGSPDRGKV